MSDPPQAVPCFQDLFVKNQGKIEYPGVEKVSNPILAGHAPAAFHQNPGASLCCSTVLQSRGNMKYCVANTIINGPSMAPLPAAVSFCR